MGWVENLKEPITKLDILYGICSYLLWKWGIIFWGIGKKMCRNIKDNRQ